MCRELMPWKFVVNCLFVAEVPLRIDDAFWKYTYIASKKVRERLPDVDIYDDRYSLEDAMLSGLFFKIDEENRTIELDRSKIDKAFLDNIVNYSLDTDIKDALPKLVKDAYATYSNL